MANNFFAQFPLIDYNMDGKGSFLTLTNIVKNVDVNDVYANNSTFYTYHDIQDGERPDTVSYRLYGTPNYYWTFFILNNELRAGLNNAWPMSYQQLERMFEREYDPYTVITFLPTSSSITGEDQSGLFNLIYLWEAYLPYLRLTNPGKTEQAKILKFDNQLLQCVVYDIEKSDGSGPPNSIDSFKDSATFRLDWVNPFDEDLEAEEWAACEELKVEFINLMVDVYAEFDPVATIDISILPELDEATQEEIDATIANYKLNYVFSKIYLPAADEYRWGSYRNAASEYYDIVDGVTYSRSAYDIVTDPNVVEPKYITFFEKEELINARKEKIRVIRADKISSFVNSYFATLNAR